MNAVIPLDSAEWSLAYERVENYLRAFRVENRLVLSRLTQHVLDRASRRSAQGDPRAPVVIAIEESVQMIQEWTEHTLAASNETLTLRHAQGRAALYLAQVPQHWPHHFLSAGPPPPQLDRELRSAYFDAGPDLDFSSMTPREIDLGPVSAAADETWRTFAKWPLLRGIVTWTAFIALAGTAFYLTRF